MPVDDLGVVAGLLQEQLGGAVFERQMRLATAEIDASVEAPGRIDERDLHASSRPALARTGAAAKAVESHADKRESPSRTPTSARQPQASLRAVVSETYQGWSPGRQSSNFTCGGLPVISPIRPISSRRLNVFFG